MSHEGRGIFERTPGFVAGQDRSEVEAEPIDMHLSDPVAQAVEDHTAHDGMIGVKRVAGAAIIGVLRAVLSRM